MPKLLGRLLILSFSSSLPFPTHTHTHAKDKRESNSPPSLPLNACFQKRYKTTARADSEDVFSVKIEFYHFSWQTNSVKLT
jgi:hypothetical protein